jgi:2-desacetyl-2-hydroxyethyl bacteriochlorophyllide A dehydrogenase
VKGAVYRGVNRLELEERPDPTPGPGDVVIEVQACGICGSDLHSISQGWVPEGTVLGHEIAGIVSAIGPGVDHVALGDRIAVVPAVPCGECSYCASGSQNLCTDLQGSAGGYSDRKVLPKGTPFFPLPDEVSLEEGSMLEPLSVAVRSVRLAAPRAEQTCVVLGLGSIGQCIVQVLRAFGVQNIVGVDLSDRRLEIGRQSGASRTINAGRHETAEELRAQFGSGTHRMYHYANVDFVFECTGAPALVGAAVRDLVRPAGTVIMVALFERDVAFDANPLVRKEVTVRGSYAYSTDDCAMAYSLLRDRQVDLSPLITHVIGLDMIGEAITAQNDTGASVKVIVTPNPGLVRA